MKKLKYVLEVIGVIVIGLPLAFIFVPWWFVNAALMPWEHGRRAYGRRR